MQKIRLQKYFTDCGVMSRRAAEVEIAAGRVRVNGHPARIGQSVIPGRDLVTLSGERIVPRRERGHSYIVLNKPRGCLTAMSDDRGRPCVSTLVADAGGRVYPIGRLDMHSEGLLLLTDDGTLAGVLGHPSAELPKRYHVRVAGEVTAGQLDVLRSPMTLDGYRIKPVETEPVTVGGDSTTLLMTLREGRNRQIRKMCERAELRIKRLRRISIGEIKLGDLAPGKWRHLTMAEVRYLRGIAEIAVRRKKELC